METDRAAAGEGSPLPATGTALPTGSSIARGRRVNLEVTPLGAFAAGALLVAGLGLAFTLGRRYEAVQNSPNQWSATSSFEQALAKPAIKYDQLAVDHGSDGETAKP